MNSQLRSFWLVPAAVLLALGPINLVQAHDGGPGVVVELAIPDVEEQGRTLDVEIRGHGFDNSAQVRFLVSRGPDFGGDIVVNAVQFVSDRKLIANITIDANADPTDFDIEVKLLNSGRKGKGTTLFRVLSSGDELVAQTRAMIAIWSPGSGGISGDGMDTCGIYDYWARGDFGINGLIPPCVAHQIRSDSSQGGRWFLISPASDSVLDIQRWLVFDFSVSTDGAPCPNFEGDGTAEGSIYTDSQMNPAFTNPDPCVDNLGVWLRADRVLKKNASRQSFYIGIMIRSTDDRWWGPAWNVKHINPLYIRDPIPGWDSSAYDGLDCRLLTTSPGPDDSDGDVSEAELIEGDGTGRDVVLGTYMLPFEACVVRARDDTN